MGVFIAAHRPLVSDEPPQWHMHSAQVTVGQRFHLFLEHLHLGLEVPVHEILVESSARYVVLTDTPEPDTSPPVTPWGRTPRMWFELPLPY